VPTSEFSRRTEAQKTLAESMQLMIVLYSLVSNREVSMSADMTTMTKAEPKSVKKTAAPKIGAVVTLKSIFEQIAESHGLAKEHAHGLAAGFVEALSNHLVKGDKLRMRGLGIIEVKNRSARMGRHPGTGDAIEIAASKTIVFRVAKELKRAL
jgi:DNA-binding protein HU-beta